MPSAAFAQLETILRTKGLDRTLTHRLPAGPTLAAAATGISAFDDALTGGFPRGEVSEVVGPTTSGRTTLLLQAVAAATGRGELVALVDAVDCLDVASAAESGIDLERVLWIRGRITASPGRCRDANARAVEHVLKSVSHVLQSGVCELVVLDLADVPARVIRDLPLTTWLRLHRMIEGSRSVCLLVGAFPLWRSARGLTIEMAAEQRWSGGADAGSPSHTRLFAGLVLRARVIRARVSAHASVCLPVSATCA